MSHGDAILAFLAESSVNTQNLGTRRAVNLTNVFNSRGIFKDDLPVNGAFIGNAALPAIVLATVSELRSSPVGEIALRLRRGLLEQKCAEQAGSYIAPQK